MRLFNMVDGAHRQKSQAGIYHPRGVVALRFERVSILTVAERAETRLQPSGRRNAIQDWQG